MSLCFALRTPALAAPTKVRSGKASLGIFRSQPRTPNSAPGKLPVFLAFLLCSSWASAAVTISKSDGKNTYVPGQSNTYLVRITNSGTTTVTDAVFKDSAIANLSVTGVTCSNATNGSACPVSASTTVSAMQGTGILIPALTPAGSVLFTVIGTVGAGTSGNLSNTATVSSAGVTSTATDTDVAVTSTVTKTAYVGGVAATSVIPGNTVTYAISQNANANINPPIDVALTDTMSSNQTYIGNVTANTTALGYACAGATLQKTGAGWTLSCPANGSAFSNTTLGTWSGAGNQPGTAGQSVFLYGNNSQYAVQTLSGSTANVLANTPIPGDGYTPFFVNDSAGDLILSAISHHSAYPGAAPTIACANFTQNTNCNTTIVESTTVAPSPTVIGTKAYFSLFNGTIGCADYASGTPVSCGQVQLISGAVDAINTYKDAAIGPMLVGGKLYMIGMNSTGRQYLGCYDPATSAVCAGTTSAGTLIYPGSTATLRYYGWFNLGNGSIAFSTQGEGTFCVKVTGVTTATNCDGTALAPITASSKQVILPISSAGSVTGFCYGASGAVPTSCLNLNLTATTLSTNLTLPTITDVSVSGSASSGVTLIPGTSRIVFSAGYSQNPNIACFDYATNTSCGSLLGTNLTYGTVLVPNSSCVISYGDNAPAGFLVYDASGSLRPSSLAACNPAVTTTDAAFSFNDPAARYCAPGSGVGNWGALTLTVNAGSIPSGTTVTFKDGTSNATIGTYVVGSVGADGAGTATVTIPQSSFPSGTTYPAHLGLNVVVSTVGMISGSTLAANLANTTLGAANPQVCYQAVVNSCIGTTSNTATIVGATAYAGSGTTSLTCTANADLAITKTDGKLLYTPGGTNTYTIVVSNNGPSNAANNTVSDPLPAGITTASWTCSGSGGGTCSANGIGAINDTAVNLPAGASVTYTLTMTVPSTFTGPLANTATVTAGPGVTDTNIANNTATDTDLSLPRVSLAKTLTGGAAATNTFNFSLTGVTNTTDVAPSVANGATVTSAVLHVGTAGTAASITETSAAGPALSGYQTSVRCTDANAPGDGNPTTPITSAATSVTIPAANMVGGAAWTCLYTNMATANVSISKTDFNGNYSPGGNGTYTITVANAATATANVSGAALSDLLPSGMTIAAPGITCTPSPGVTCMGSGSPAGTAGTGVLNVLSGLSLMLPPGGAATIVIPVVYSGNPSNY